MIKFGDKEFKTKKPQDLDQRLLGACGINGAEMAAQLRGNPRPQVVARGLLPFLGDDAPSMPELADLISRNDVRAIQADVLKLYADQAEAPPVEPVA